MANNFKRARIDIASRSHVKKVTAETVENTDFEENLKLHADYKLRG